MPHAPAIDRMSPSLFHVRDGLFSGRNPINGGGKHDIAMLASHTEKRKRIRMSLSQIGGSFESVMDYLAYTRSAMMYVCMCVCVSKNKTKNPMEPNQIDSH